MLMHLLGARLSLPMAPMPQPPFPGPTCTPSGRHSLAGPRRARQVRPASTSLVSDVVAMGAEAALPRLRRPLGPATPLARADAWSSRVVCGRRGARQRPPGLGRHVGGGCPLLTTPLAHLAGFAEILASLKSRGVSDFFLSLCGQKERKKIYQPSLPFFSEKVCKVCKACKRPLVT